MATDCKVFPCLWCQLYFQVRCCFSWQHKGWWCQAITAPRHNSNMTLMVRNHSTLHMHWKNLLSPLLTLFSHSNHWNVKHFWSVFWGPNTHPGCTPNVMTTDTFSPWRVTLYYGRREAIYQLCNLLPTPNKVARTKKPPKKTTALQHISKKQDDLSVWEQQQEELNLTCKSKCAHTSAHKPRPVWGHFTLHSPTSIFHLHNREGAAREEESPPWNN